MRISTVRRVGGLGSPAPPAGGAPKAPGLRSGGRFPAAERQRAMQALQRVGMEDRAWQRAGTLSGGQQQRAAISRALVQGARIILAEAGLVYAKPAVMKSGTLTRNYTVESS